MRNPVADTPAGLPAGQSVVYSNSVSTTPRAGRDRPNIFLRLIAWVLIATMSTSSLAQAVGPMNRGSNGQPYTGFTKNGTFVQGGQVVGNPHQELHDLLKPGLWTTAAASFTNSTDPSFTQSVLADIEASIAVTPEPGGLALSRLYITIPPAAPTANPYLDPSAGAPGCDPATTCNQAIYNQLLLDAQASGYVATADGTHIGKTHPSSSDSISTRGFNLYQTKPVFLAAENPGGGATAFFALQGAAALAHLTALQGQSVANLGGLIFYSQQTLRGPGTGVVNRGYDGEVYDPGAAFDAALGSAPANPSSTRNDFRVGYIQNNGQAHAFDLLKDPHFNQFTNNAGYGTGEWGADQNSGNPSDALLGNNLRTAGIQNQKGQEAVANINFDWVKDDRDLFYQGVNLYNVGNKSDNALLRQLELGQIAPGHPDYNRARGLAEQRFTLAYQAKVEYDLKTKFTREGAAYQAQQLNFDDFDSDKLFDSGLNLFDKKGDPEQERLLGMLQRGELKPGDARDDEIRGLAEARYRVAYQKALEPPKKANPLKALVAVVVAAVVTFYTAGAASGWAAAAMSTTTTTVTVGVGTAGVAAAGVGTAIGAYAGTVISTGIQTGSLDKALAAGEKSLKGSLAKIAVDMLATQLGLPTSGVGGFAVRAVGNAVTSVALSGGDFGQALLQGSINAGVEIVAKDVANQIGAAKDTLGTFGVELAHAGVGCASALARGGNSESCGAGAVGAVVAHAGGEYVDRSTGRNMSDSELSFYASLGGGVAAALVGGSNNVQTNFNTGQQTGQNAVDNNYLTIRDVKAARELIAANCKTNCSSMLAAIEQTSARKGSGLEQTCQTAPEACAVTIKEIVGGLKELQSDATRQAFAQTPAVLQRLVDKQVSDLEGAAKGLNYAADNAESLASVRSVINGALLVGVGGVGLGIVTRVMMGACASGAASPSCVAATQEIAQGLIETASGVPLPTIGLSVTAAGATAQKLADLAETAKDASQLAKEIQLVRAEVAAGRNGANRGTGSVIAADAAGGAKNPLLADAMPRNGDRLVLNQGNVPTCGANSCGMALDTMGRPVDVATLIQRIPPSAEGIYSTDVATLMKSQGVDAIALGMVCKTSAPLPRCETVTA